MGEISKLAGYGLAFVSFAATIVIGIAILDGFKTSGALLSNSTVDLFVTGLAIFGTFASIITLALTGKTVIGLFKKGN